MDQTSVYIDTFGNFTYEMRGSKRVGLTSTGNQKTRVSVSLCASADGTKLKTIFVIPRKQPLANYQPPSNVIVEYISKAYSTPR